VGRVNQKLDESVSIQTAVDWFNLCLLELAPHLLLEAYTEIPVTGGIDTYTLPSNALPNSIIQAKYQSESVALPRLTLDVFDRSGYKVFDNKIQLLPAPTTDDVLLLWYHRLPASLSTNDLTQQPEVPPMFQNLLVLYACLQYLDIEEETERLASIQREYDTLFTIFMRYMRKKRGNYRTFTWDVVRTRG